MNKTTKIIIIVAVVAIIVGIIGVVIALNSNKETTKLAQVTSAEDLSALVDKIYEGQDSELLPMLFTNTIDVSDESMVKMSTGLDNGNDIEFLVTSEPLMTGQAYSLVLLKVKDNVNANSIAQKMSEQIDPRKWICVTAEKIYATNSGNIVCLVMSSEERAKPVYEAFKEQAGKVGQEYEKTIEETIDF